MTMTMSWVEKEANTVAKKLTGTDGGRTFAVVLQAAELLKKERGTLDYENTLLAVRTLIEAITPEKQISKLITNLKKIDDESFPF